MYGSEKICVNFSCYFELHSHKCSSDRLRARILLISMPLDLNNIVLGVYLYSHQYIYASIVSVFQIFLMEM